MCVCFIMRRHISVILESWLQGMFVILFLEVWFSLSLSVCVCVCVFVSPLHHQNETAAECNQGIHQRLYCSSSPPFSFI